MFCPSHLLLSRHLPLEEMTVQKVFIHGFGDQESTEQPMGAALWSSTKVCSGILLIMNHCLEV